MPCGLLVSTKIPRVNLGRLYAYNKTPFHGRLFAETRKTNSEEQ
jgi:hypothetical protein